MPATTASASPEMKSGAESPKMSTFRPGELWPDGTPNNTNWLYVMGNGQLKTGWFGGQTHKANTVYRNSNGSTSIGTYKKAK